MTSYRVTQRADGSHVAHSTSWEEEVAEGVGTAAGWAIGSAIDVVGSLARNARDRKMVRTAQELEAASEGDDPARFLSLATEFTRRYPREEFGHAHRAHALFLTERFDDALVEAARGVELGLDEWHGHRMRAEILDAMGRTGVAIQAYTHLLHHPDHRHDALLGRAGCLIELGDLDAAFRDADAAVALLPDEHAYFVRGNVRRLRGELDDCLRDYSRAITLCPDSVDLLKCRAEVYEMTQRVAEARRDRAAARRLAP
jgi:tetratricopeptide (TPR) repeat protein